MPIIERARTPSERQAAILERIATNAILAGTLDEIVGLIEAQLPGAIGALLLLEPDGRSLRCASVRGLPPSFSALMDGLEVGDCIGSCGTAVHRREPVFVTDIASDPLWAGFRDLAASHGLRACWSAPIVSRRRALAQVLGTFAVYFLSPRAPSPADREALSNAEYLACIALEAHTAVRELRESDTRLRLFVDHATDGFFVLDTSSSAIVEVNEQACASLGYRRDELIGALTTQFDRTAARIEVNQRLAGGEVVTFESRHIRKDGSQFPVEVRIRAFEAGGQSYHLAVARDITARRELEGQLRHAQKMEAVGRLAGGVAHDFNNLLTVINGYTDVLLHEIPPDAPERADLTMIREAGERAASLTAQLLAFSRRSIIAPKPLDLNTVVARLARMCQHIIGEHIALATRLDPTPCMVMADAGQIEQVVMNLVVNARDAMPRGGALTITTANTVTATGQFAYLAVSDTGEGMTDDVRARAFEPFFTTKPPGQGSGLGLATAYGIVEQAGGQIQIETAPGNGSVFTVILPTVDVPEAAAAPLVRDRPRGSETVLLAEDEDAVRWLVQRALESHGYRVLPARTGEEAEAIERAYRGPIQLLITDVVMPGIPGSELADALRARRPQLRVLFMSGYTNDEVVRHGVSVARDSLLQKPFSAQALLAIVRRALGDPGPAPLPA
jgi:two-component system, cell cycle sensor histidine kinase and response regulator CckA